MMNFEKELVALYPWLLRQAGKYCHSVQDAEDLVGETIYKLLVNKEKFEEGRPLKPWCEVIMLNTYITSYNRGTIIRFVGYDKVYHVLSGNDASDAAILHEIYSIIRRCALKSCSVECVLFYAKGYSYDEISEFLHIPVGTVRSRIYFGRKLLSQALSY